jgi:hypothetical protein
MIARTLTDLYLRHFDFLHGALCLCWQTAFCNKTKQLDKTKLKEKILSYGIYNHENALIIEDSVSVKDKPLFKTLTWVNDYSYPIDDALFCKYIELYRQALKEVEDNIFILKDKAERIAYANIILRDFDKSYRHNQTINDTLQNNKCKEFFEFVLNRQFISENDSISVDNDQNTALPNYDLSARLINHFHFIDKLIELFLCFDICLISLAEKANCNLYTFTDHKHKLVENPDFQINALHKFNSRLSDECLVKTMHYLSNKKLLDTPDCDSWLFWFNRKTLKNPLSLKWKGTPTMLSNVIQHLCGASCSNTIKIAFCTKEYTKPTRKEYESGRTYKEIEQIITVSKQKK